MCVKPRLTSSTGPWPYQIRELWAPLLLLFFATVFFPHRPLRVCGSPPKGSFLPYVSFSPSFSKSLRASSDGAIHLAKLRVGASSQDIRALGRWSNLLHPLASNHEKRYWVLLPRGRPWWLLFHFPFSYLLKPPFTFVFLFLFLSIRLILQKKPVDYLYSKVVL